MRIPKGEFGLRAPSEVAHANVAPGAFVQPGLNDMGEGGLKVGAAMAQDAVNDAQLEAGERRKEQLAIQAEERQIFRESKRAEAITIHAEGANALGDAHDEIVNGIGSGAIKKEDAPRVWEERSKKVVEDSLARVDKTNSELVRASLATNIGSFGRQINKAVTQRAQYDVGAQLNQTLEQLQRSAERDLPNSVVQADMALDSQGPLAGMNPEQIGKAKQSFKESATFNKLNNEVIGSRTSMRGLQALQTQIAANQDLDPAKRNALLNTTETQILNLQNKAEAAARRREASAVRAINVLEKQISLGLPVDAKSWVATQTAVKGTEFAPLVDGMMQAEREVQQLLSKPIPEQIAFVNAQKAQANATGGLREKAYADRLEKTIGNNVQMLTQTPLVYAVQRQGAEAAPLDLGNAGAWGDILAARLTAVDPLSKQFGVGKRLLYPEEAKQLAGLLQGSSSVQATQTFAALRKAIPDDKAYRDTIAQIAPDDPVTAYAGTLTGKTKAAVREGWFSNTTGPDPSVVSRTMLDGRRILAPTKGEKGEDGNRKGMFKMPADKDFDPAFESITRGVYAGNTEARSIDMQAVRAYYAGKASSLGKFDGIVDDNLVREAVDAVTGGVSNKYRVIKPYGWAEDQFRDQVNKSWKTLVKAQGLPPQLATSNVNLRNSAQEGQYFVMDGSSYLKGANGQPVMINVTGGQ